MAQAAIELPDPLDLPTGVSVPSADDLLSQLAGDEIDRLLAEAEGQQSPKSNTAEPASPSRGEDQAAPGAAVVETQGSPADAAAATSEVPAVPAAPAPAAPQVQPDLPAAESKTTPPAASPTQILKTIESAPRSAPTNPRAAPAAHATSAFEGPLAQELDDLFQQLDGYSDELNSKAAAAPSPAEVAQPTATTDPAAVTQPAEATQATAPAPPPPAAEVQPHPAASPQVASVAVAAAPVAPTAPATQSAMSAIEEGDDGHAALMDDGTDPDPVPCDHVPVYLLPLVWLSAPLSPAPKWVRNLVGQLGILTTFNAILVLLYVLIFRKH